MMSPFVLDTPGLLYPALIDVESFVLGTPDLLYPALSD